MGIFVPVLEYREDKDNEDVEYLYNRSSWHMKGTITVPKDLHSCSQNIFHIPWLQTQLTQKTGPRYHKVYIKWHLVLKFIHFKTNTTLHICRSHSSQKEHTNTFWIWTVLPWVDTIFCTLQYHLKLSFADIWISFVYTLFQYIFRLSFIFNHCNTINLHTWNPRAGFIKNSHCSH